MFAGAQIEPKNHAVRRMTADTIYNMNTIQVFNHEQFGSIRTMEMPDGQIGFVGKDIAQVLGYSRTADAIRQHVDDEDKGVFKMQTPGGVQSIVLINESGLYLSLIHI